MAFRFQKRVSILPGVRLNFSRSGISTTIGIPGASVTLGGSRGPALSVGIPGTGLSLRTPLAPTPQRRQRAPSAAPAALQRSTPAAAPLDIEPPPAMPLPAPSPAITTPPMKAIQSEAVSALTTEGLATRPCPSPRS